MHGIVLKGLKDFVVEEFDSEVWNEIQRNAPGTRTIYVPVSSYSDEEALALVGAATEVTGIDAPDLLETFGKFLVASLVRTYGVHVDENWTGLDLVANVEKYIHEALRAKQISEFTPPKLESHRLDEHRVLIRYGSERELCDLARGLVLGIGEYYGEPMTVTERTCMHDGAPVCELIVSQVAGPDLTPDGTLRQR